MKYDFKKIINEINKKEEELSFGVIGIRSLSDDEDYREGEYCRNSYEWDHENDQSTYHSADSAELNGTCAIDATSILYFDTEDERAEEALHCALSKSQRYYGKKAIIAGDLDGYGEDEGEIIIRNAQVLILLD